MKLVHYFARVMNLHRFKKLIGKNDPEKGLRDLPGARKADKRIEGPETVRVKGRYIPPNTDNAGMAFGVFGFIMACIYAVLLPCSFFAVNTMIFSPLAVFILGFATVHGCAIFADSLRHSEAPWARKGIKIFWICTLLTFASSLIF